MHMACARLHWVPTLPTTLPPCKDGPVTIQPGPLSLARGQGLKSTIPIHCRIGPVPPRVDPAVYN